MTKRWVNTLVGLGLATATGIALPVLLGANSNGEDLRVKVATERSYEVLSTPQAGRSLVEFQPKDVSTQHLLKEGESGLNLTTWSKTYGGSYVREVTWPTLTGPFHAENDFVCGYSLQLGAGLFDTTGAGAGLQKLVHDKLANLFPLTEEVEGITVSLPALESSKTSIVLENGREKIVFNIRLIDGTTLDIAFFVRMITRNGRPLIQRIVTEVPDVRFDGPSRERILEQARSKGALSIGLLGCVLGIPFGPIGIAAGCIGGAGVGTEYGENEANAQIPAQTQNKVIEKIDDALRFVALGLGRLGEPFHPFSDRPGDEVSLRLEGNPSVDPLGITLPLCVRIAAADPRVDATIPGPVALGGERIAHGTLGPMAPVVGLTLNGDATNQLVYYVWQAGLLKKVGASSMVLDALSDQVQMAAFDFTGFSPGLPPTLAPSLANSPGLPFVFGNIKIGSLSNKAVVGHGVAMLGLVQVGDVIELNGRLGELHVNCVSKDETGIFLSPCMSDLLPVVRDMAEAGKAPSHRFNGTELLTKLPQLGFQGLEVHLSDLHAASTSGPLGILITANARVE